MVGQFVVDRLVEDSMEEFVDIVEDKVVDMVVDKVVDIMDLVEWVDL